MSVNTALPRVATREEWLAARVELLRKEKELTRVRDALSAERRQLPMVKIEKDYRFQTVEGERSLADLFEGKRQLVVHHFMWIDDADEGCKGCSMQVDTIGDLPVHLRAADTTLVFVSRAPLAKLETYRARMGWRIPLISSAGSDFNYDFHVTLDPRRGATTYNFRDVSQLGGWWATFVGDMPGVSVFLREGSDVYHTYSAYARGTEPESNLFGFLDFTPLGRQGDNGPRSWVRHRDRYEEAPVMLGRRRGESSGELVSR
jgi:predicted dithiol-disulfide oxidoreductase (DUF899 family)